MKSLLMFAATGLALSLPAQATDLDERLKSVLAKACASGGPYAHHGISLGMSQAALAELGSAPVKANFPSSGSSSVRVDDKTLIMWSTPEAPDQPRYRIDYARGATPSFSQDEARAFVDEQVRSFGEPKIRGEGKSFMDAGYPTLFYGPDDALKRQMYAPVSACLRPQRQISSHDKAALANFTPRNFRRAVAGLQAACPDQVDAYFDYMAYSLQPEVHVTTGKRKFRIDMRCPAESKIGAILKH